MPHPLVFLERLADTLPAEMEVPWQWFDSGYDPSHKDGTFVFRNVLPGTYRLRFESQAYYHTVAPSASEPGLTVGPGEAVTVRAVRLRRKPQLTGRILQSNGVPLIPAGVLR